MGSSQPKTLNHEKFLELRCARRFARRRLFCLLLLAPRVSVIVMTLDQGKHSFGVGPSFNVYPFFRRLVLPCVPIDGCKCCTQYVYLPIKMYSPRFETRVRSTVLYFSGIKHAMHCPGFTVPGFLLSCIIACNPKGWFLQLTRVFTNEGWLCFREWNLENRVALWRGKPLQFMFNLIFEDKLFCQRGPAV